MNSNRGYQSHRGGRGGRGGGGGGGHNKGGNDSRGGQQQGGQAERKPPILDLAQYMDKGVNVKLMGGREVTGTLKGYDPLLNLVLDNVKEIIRDEENNTQTRDLGLVVVRGPLLTLISPMDGAEEIPNPFIQQE
ncbi:U6 snRNA-associated Sm-like protein LSm7 [Ascobolus immersus RN42]|uniref:U6 snRNA-associated Sm-like protein LSm7 n=1 Tax=Ascobolus immersus RN42 TaxID=1160509 RepID=A0A3N4I3S7_ASCIM|nr:U6 snRNA-associated Sm-like protein LSm7 [Ascobolus immersus RN42]